MRQILIIDDDRELCALLQEYLDAEGFACRFAHSGLDALCAPDETDLIILDVMLPGKSGFEVLAELRADPVRAGLPVIMLTARGEDVNRVVGLEMGADDYLSKPFNPRVLLARIRAVLRRASISPAFATIAPSANIPSIILDEGALRVRVEGKSIELTGQECRLLRLLLETPGELVSREKLCKEGMGHSLRPFDRSLDMQVSRIRKKLGTAKDGAERIRSVRSEGYILLTEGLAC